ncbi:heavy-metal-associated domain-containing protein [Flavobacterium macrobrachii]
MSCKETGNKPSLSESTNAVSSTEKKVAQKPETATLKIDGMTCSMGCAKTIERKLTEMDGVQEAKVDFDKKEATVSFDAAVLSPEKLSETVEATADGKTYKVSDVKIKA